VFHTCDCDFGGWELTSPAMATAVVPKFEKYWKNELASLRAGYIDVVRRYTEAACVIGDVQKILGDICHLANSTPTEVV
jgi:hypothetical protein